MANFLSGLLGSNTGPQRTAAAGLLGKYYDPAEKRRMMLSQGLMGAGIGMLQNGRGSTGEVIGNSLAAGLMGANNAGINYKQDAMGYNKLAMDMEEQARQRKTWAREDTEYQYKLDQRDDVMKFVNSLSPEDQKLAEAFPEKYAEQYLQSKFSTKSGTDDITEYGLAVKQGYKGTFTDYMTEMKKAGAQNITIGGGKYGTIPQGYELVEGPNGATLRAIPGGPEDKSGPNAVKADRTGVSRALVLDEIQAAKQLVADDSWLSPRTGLSGKVMSNFDNTRAGALKNRLETIKANIGFDRLQAMREASPTGGALGPVSDFENRLLQAVMGSLEQAQSAPDIKYNLERLERIYDRVINQGIPEEEARQLYQELVTGAGSGDGWTVLPNGVKIRKKAQ